MGHAVDMARRLGLDGVRYQHYNYLRPEEMLAQDKVMGREFGLACQANEIENVPESLEGMAASIKAFKEVHPSLTPGLPVQWAPTLDDDEIDMWYGSGAFRTKRKCLYPWRGVLLDADGKLFPCSKIYLELGDLAKEDALRAWNGTTMQHFRKRLKNRLYPACARCCKL
jgi:hypothetical protein